MDKTTLITLIENAAAAIQPLPWGTDSPYIRLTYSRFPNINHEHLTTLVDHLRTEQDVLPFLDTQQLLTNYTPNVTVFDAERLAKWLAVRARQESPNEALMSLNHYITSETVTYSLYLALIGPTIEQKIDMAGDISLIPYGQVAASPGRILAEGGDEAIIMTSGGPTIVYRPTAALLCRSRISRIHFPATESEVVVKSAKTKRKHEIDEVYNRLYDTYTLLATLGAWLPITAGSWCDVDDSAPDLTFPLVQPQLEPASNVQYRPFTQENYNSIHSEHESWSKLDNGSRGRLHIVCDRTTSAKHRRRPVDAAIDLGIAMEALFIDRDEGTDNITDKLRTRAARYLRKDIAERKSVRDEVNLLYTMRSNAAHTGKFYDKKLEKLSEDELQEKLYGGYTRMAEAVRKVVHNGFPIWRDFMLE